ncbi:MAG: hypothetical protein K2M49_06380 [Muribaculaceae bacterium]|nr:hypothetical protein [Muribaculaceae bacterium]
MDDDKLKDIFAGFNPEISDSADFMASLNRHLELAELARQRIEAARRRSKRAVIIAAIAGFGGGVMSALCYPALLRLAASWSAEAAPTLAVAVLSALTLLLTYAAYDLALASSEIKH